MRDRQWESESCTWQDLIVFGVKPLKPKSPKLWETTSTWSYLFISLYTSSFFLCASKAFNKSLCCYYGHSGQMAIRVFFWGDFRIFQDELSYTIWREFGGVIWELREQYPFFYHFRLQAMKFHMYLYLYMTYQFIISVL